MKCNLLIVSVSASVSFAVVSGVVVFNFGWA